KKLRNQLKQQQQKLAKEGPVPLKRALQVLKGLKRAKFDETVEVHVSLGIDPTQSDQMIRGSVPLPHGLGKPKRVLIFCQGGNVHAGVGKISLDDERLAANITVFVDQIRAVKPSGVKGNYVRSITIASTMSPGVPVSM